MGSYFLRGALEVGSALLRLGNGLLVPPLLYFCFMATEQYIGHFQTFKFGRPRINRRGQQPVLKGVCECRTLIIEDARNEASNRIRQDDRRNFSTAQDKIPDRYLHCDEPVPYALVDAFVMSAYQKQLVLQREPVGHFLVEGLSIRRQVDDGVIPAGLLTERADGLGEGLRPEDHAGTAAVLVVIDLPVFTQAEGFEVKYIDFKKPLLSGSFDNRMFERAGEQFGDDGQDINPHDGGY